MCLKDENQNIRCNRKNRVHAQLDHVVQAVPIQIEPPRQQIRTPAVGPGVRATVRLHRV